jgi:predicted nucleotidyltransferase
MLPSGKFVLRLDPALHQRLRDEAVAHSTSLNNWIMNRLDSRSPDQNAKIVSTVRNTFGENLTGVVQFGSSVRNEMRKGSDIDLLIVLDSSASIERSLYRKWDKDVAPVLGEKYSPQFSHLPAQESATSLWLEIAVEGEILFARDFDLKTCLRQLRTAIAEGRFVRKLSYGIPYWMQNVNVNAIGNGKRNAK